MIERSLRKVLHFALLVRAFLFALAIMQATSAYSQETTTEEAAAQSYLSLLQNPELSRADLRILIRPLSEPELGKVAEIWRGYLQANLEQIASQAIASKPIDDLSPGQRDVLFDKQRALELGYRDILAEWKTKGAEPAAIKPHDLYIKAALKVTVRSIDPQYLKKTVERWLASPEGGLQVLYNLIGFGVVIWLLLLLASFSRRVTERLLRRTSALSRILKKFLLQMTYWATLMIGGVIVLIFVGVNVTPFFAIFGGISFILGFALQQTIGNLASGLMMMVLKPFDTGDSVQVAGTSGQVDEMSVVSTRIRTADNQIITIPNGMIWGDVITNVSASEIRRVDLVFGIDYSDSASQAINILEDMIRSNPLCLKDPAPQVFVGELAESSVNIFCRPWVKREDYWTIYWGLTGAVKERFDAEGISIPFPQQDVHVISK